MGRAKPLNLRDKVEALAQAAFSKKAERVVSLDVRGISPYADSFIVCSGSHPRQNQAIAEAVIEKLNALGEPALGVEGREAGSWILIDADDVVIHIFDEGTRQYYDLERLWHDAPAKHHTDLPSPAAAAARRR